MTKPVAAGQVTAVIPAYKAADRIERTIASFFEDKAAARAVVVIDDGCATTADIARGFGPRVEVLVNERNIGASASRNRGLAEVRTDYVLFLDSDDRVEPPLLTGLVALAQVRNLDIVFGRYVVEVEGRGTRLPGQPVSEERSTLFAQWLVGDAYVPPCGVLWRTDYVRSIGGWNEQVSRWDDAELALRAILMGAHYGFSDSGLAVYLWHWSPDRVSKQSSRAADMVTTVRNLLAIANPAVPLEAVRHASAEAAYEIARVAFAEEQKAVGREALALARSLGFAGHRGGTVAKMTSAVLGLEGRMRLRDLLSRAGRVLPRSSFERKTAR